MQKNSRSQGGVAYIKKEYHIKLQKIMNIVTFTYVGIFIAVQTGVLIATVANLVDPSKFLIELNTLIFFLMVFLNVFALVNYCRNAGNPYLTEKNKKYVRKYKIIIVIWNFAYIMKFFMSSFGVTIVDIDKQSEETDDFWYSVETFVNIMFTEIIPFYFVLDKKIIKIFTCKFLETEDSQEMEISPRDNLDESRNHSDNSVDLEDDGGENQLYQSSKDRLLTNPKLSRGDGSAVASIRTTSNAFEGDEELRAT